MGFRPGQLVCCINDDPCPDCGAVDQATRGRIYTVSRIHPLGYISLEEISPPAPHDCWLPERFRPLDESRLTVFRQMLVSPPKKELVEDHLDASIADCERAVREALGF